jgi:hypothetical protein
VTVDVSDVVLAHKVYELPLRLALNKLCEIAEPSAAYQAVKRRQSAV